MAKVTVKTIIDLRVEAKEQAAEIKRLKAQLDSYHDAEKFVAAPPHDQECCGCVAILRKQNTDLKAQLDKLRWIPVAEGLPKNGRCVYVVMTTGMDTWGFQAYYNTVKKIWEPYDPMVRGKVTHWKPITLPKKERE